MIKKYRVSVEKADGMKSNYFVAALSAGGAEITVLKNVYNAKFAIAKECDDSFYGDLISEGAARQLLNEKEGRV